MVSDLVHICFFTPLYFIGQKFGHGSCHSPLLMQRRTITGNLYSSSTVIQPKSGYRYMRSRTQTSFQRATCISCRMTSRTAPAKSSRLCPARSPQPPRQGHVQLWLASYFITHDCKLWFYSAYGFRRLPNYLIRFWCIHSTEPFCPMTTVFTLSNSAVP